MFQQKNEPSKGPDNVVEIFLKSEILSMNFDIIFHDCVSAEDTANPSCSTTETMFV